MQPIRPLPAGVHPPRNYSVYKSTALRHPQQPLLKVPQGTQLLQGPRFSKALLPPNCADLTVHSSASPLGDRIMIHGTIVDEDGHALPNTLVEIWQCNAAGRYQHPVDQHDAPLDPHFHGGGMVLTDAQGHYIFTTIKPGAYPWGNHPNAWRPAHVHFSVFGESVLQRLVTQMYFPGDPLLAYDPIFGGLPSDKARDSLVSRFDIASTKPGWALAYAFDVVLSGRAGAGTPAQPDAHAH